MMTFHFDPKTRLIVFEVDLVHQIRWTFKMALDTGASTPLITPEAAQIIGFDLTSPALEEETGVTASRPEHGVKLVIPKLIFYKEALVNHPVFCRSLPKELGVSGLLGLNFMQQFKITLDFISGLISFERPKME